MLLHLHTTISFHPACRITELTKTDSIPISYPICSNIQSYAPIPSAVLWTRSIPSTRNIYENLFTSTTIAVIAYWLPVLSFVCLLHSFFRSLTGFFFFLPLFCRNILAFSFYACYNAVSFGREAQTMFSMNFAAQFYFGYYYFFTVKK